MKNLNSFLPFASPLSPIIRENDNTQAFPSSNEEVLFDWINRDDEASVLYLSSNSRVAQASRDIYETLRKTKGHHDTVFFEFSSGDPRYSTLHSMLSTILALLSIRYSKQEYIDEFSDSMDDGHTWHDLALFSCLTLALFSVPATPSTYIISALDQCQSSIHWFLEALELITTKSERRLKFIVTATETPEIREVFRNRVSQHLESGRDHDVQCVSHPVESHVAALGASLAAHVNQGVSNTEFANVFAKCGSEDAQQLLRTWVLSANHIPDPKLLRGKVQAFSKMDSITSEAVILAILYCIPHELHDLGRRFLALMVGETRLFTKLEIESLLAATLEYKTSDEEHDCFEDRIERLFRCIDPLIVEMGNSLLRPHSSLGSLLISDQEVDLAGTEQNSEKLWCQFHHRDVVHIEITRTLLEYLCCHRLEYGEEKATSINRSGALLYSICQWPYHYRLSGTSDILTSLAIKVISPQDGEKSSSWATMFYSPYRPASKGELPLSSPMCIAASLGLNDLILRLISSSLSDLQLATAEAIRHGHPKSLRILLSEIEKNGAIPGPAIIQAMTGCDNADCVVQLGAYASKLTDREPSLDRHLFALSCRFGLVDLLEELPLPLAIEEFATDAENPAPSWPVMVAPNQETIIKSLLSKDLEIDRLEKIGLTTLHQACRWGDINLAKTWLTAGANINCRDSDDNTPLQVACAWGKYEVVELLTNWDPKPDLNSGEHDSRPLIICSKYGFSKSLRLLLVAGALDEQDEVGQAAVVSAVKNNKVDTCRILLEEAHVTFPVIDDVTDTNLLDIAINNANVEMVKLLTPCLTKGEPGSEADEGSKKAGSEHLGLARALLKVARQGSLPIVDALLKGGVDVNVEVDDDDGKTPLHAACLGGHASVVQHLVDCGANVDKLTSRQWGPLQMAYDFPDVTSILLGGRNKLDINHVCADGSAIFLAARYDCRRVVEILLKNGADVDSRSPGNDSTPLLTAATNAHPETVRILLEAGADIEARTTNNSTPLHCATWFLTKHPSSSVECVQALLEYRASVQACDNQGDTALHCISEVTPVRSVELLLHAGGDKEVENKLGYTSLGTAIRYGNLKAAEYLVSKKAQVNTLHGEEGPPLHLACKKRTVEYVKLLVENGALVDVAFPGQITTPLQLSCLNENEDNQKAIIEYLLGNEYCKAEINRESGQYGYAINVACLFSSAATVELLIDKEADINVNDDVGRNPAQLASLRTLDHVSLLSKHPWLFKSPDKMGRTAIHYAVASGDIKVVRRVFELSGCSIDEKDLDGWTPLMWAVRCQFMGGKKRSGEELGDGLEEIVRFLVEEKDADLWVRARGPPDREWSPLKLARYHGASRAILSLLKPKMSTTEGFDDRSQIGSQSERSGKVGGEEWDKSWHYSKRGIWEERLFCSTCLFVSWCLI
jgi:ankyrin repeat protein